MKKIILALSLLTLTTAVKVSAQEAATPAAAPVDKKAPQIKFETEKIDYGTIEHNANGDRTFKFKNTGKSPLIITEAHGSCGCTVPTWPKEPIPPGGKGEIKVHYATDRVGVINKTVTVTSNAATPSVTLSIVGTVKPDPETTAPAKAAN